MRRKVLCAFVFVAVALAAASAQTKFAFSGKCGKADNVQSIPAGDKEGHTFMIQQGKCTTDKGEIGGAKSKDGAYSEHDDAMGNRVKGWGVYVENYDSGDKIFYDYQGTVMTKDGAVVSGNNTWRMTGGTGKMKGIKGSGSCKFTPGEGGGQNYDCTGTYTQAAAK